MCSFRVVRFLGPVEFDGAGDAVVFAGEGVVFAEGVSEPVVREEDAAGVCAEVVGDGVWVVGEGDAEEVEGLAFMPVGGAPEVGDGGDFGVIAGYEDFDAELVAEVEAEEVVGGTELAAVGIVEAGEAAEEVELELGVVAEEGGNFEPLGGGDTDPGVEGV